MDSTNLPQVVVLSTGGTIAGSGASTMSLTEYQPGALLGTELVEAVPELKQFAHVRVEQICNIASPDITIAVWRQLARRINVIFSEEPDIAGVVITHGKKSGEYSRIIESPPFDRHERRACLEALAVSSSNRDALLLRLRRWS